MPSAVLAWLDCSEADQRRAREIVAMFSQPESRDELGLGQIRDALSDTLFPGTSVLLTRARYLLFVPWFCREGARRGRQGSQLSSWVDAQERRLIGALRNGEDTSGLIGGVVGERVQNLPSTIYWNSLRRFGILRHDGSPAQIAGLRQVSRPLDDATEFVERPDAVWDPSMPAPPEDFFARNCSRLRGSDRLSTGIAYLATALGTAKKPADLINSEQLPLRSPVAILLCRETKRPGLLNVSGKLRPILCSHFWSGKATDALKSPRCLG